MKKSLIPLLFLVVTTNCSLSFGKDVALAQGQEGNQIFCPLGNVYIKETDSCTSVFKEIKEKPKAEKKNVVSNSQKIQVISMITVKKRDTCIGLTKYSLNDCIKLGREYGRMPSIFIAMDDARTFDVPLYVGEQIAYVRITNEDKTTYTKYILSPKK
jgi:hypothetical protein